MVTFKCLFYVYTWFSQNGLVINPEKSEAVLLSIIQHDARASSSPLTDVNVHGWLLVPLTGTVKLLLSTDMARTITYLRW